ncbi:MAG: ABC transporter permease [Saprospiraceae bacterium]|nr:MAG: ABC transporter permease [Saprospiraceae bacterium]
MWQNYLKTAWRNLLKNKGFSLINIAGLAIGIAGCLLIMLYVVNELSYERWNPNADRIVRPVSDIKFGGNEFKMAVVGSIVGPDSGLELPEVESWCRFRQHGSDLVKVMDRDEPNNEENDVLTVDSTFFKIFPVPMLEGDPDQCLKQPNTVAISRSAAERYFTSPQEAMGQTLLLENQERRVITGVFEDLPTNTHFRADFLLSMNGNNEVKNAPPFWAMDNNFQTYLLLKEGTDIESFKTKFKDYSRGKVGITAQQILGSTIEEIEATGQHARYYMQTLPNIHLYSDLNVELAPNGSIRYVWIFSAIAAFILLIACINFMNLSTARSSNRAREIGMRKILGSRRRALVKQFLSESTLIAAIAVGVAVQLAALALPWYNELADRQLTIPWEMPIFWGSLVATIGIVGLLAGSYPAFFLSAFDALKVLKGEFTGKGKGGGFRSTLVVFQFVTSVSLIIATLLVFKQLNYIQHKKLGFNKSQVLILDNAYALGDKVDAMKEAMLQLPAVEKATISSYLPVPSSRSTNSFSKSRSMTKEDAINLQCWRVDSDYLQTLGIEIAQGRDFDPKQLTDSSAVILNETAAQLLGSGDPIGKRIYYLNHNNHGESSEEGAEEYLVIGVVKNFHWSSLRDNIGPLCMVLDNNSVGKISFRYQAAATSSVINALERNWKTLAPDQPFDYQFLDEAFSAQYSAEQRIGQIMGIFTLLSIFISCLGLFGLASYATEQRTKEIGIRKVLGASVENIVLLMSKDFLKLVIIGVVLAIPIGWWGVSKWLENFAFRAEIGWWTFTIAGILAVTIAFITISLQSVRAARTNPVKSLRSE